MSLRRSAAAVKNCHEYRERLPFYRARHEKLSSTLLVGIRLLVKRDGVYSLTPESKTFLVQDSPLFMGPMIEVSKDLAGSFDHLANKRQKRICPLGQLNRNRWAPNFSPDSSPAFFLGNYPIARAVADQRLLGNVRDILDVAIGSGAWSIPLAASDPNIRVTGLDFQDVLPITRGFFSKSRRRKSIA